MISVEELKKLANTRLKDAEILHKNHSHDGAIYLCGYAIELGLKAIVCKNLNQMGTISISHIPSTKDEFRIIQSLATHKIDDLLSLAPPDIIKNIKTKYLEDWSIVQQWNVEMRYSPIRGQQVSGDAESIISSTRRILNYIWRQM
jgi:HEPN domain-containing protein